MGRLDKPLILSVGFLMRLRYFNNPWMGRI